MTTTTQIHVALNEQGRVIGEGHPNASLTDREVELMRTMHEQGCGPTELARAFEISKRYCIKILQFEARNQTVDRHHTRSVG